ncbi:MAG TPA: sulfite exporter TauE/SafE family protein [Desulfobacterales bacterium]|nr:sulfite exporter TauE/SafE family protein [Desulfobacterales bacterium]
MERILWVNLIVGGAALVQSLAGFGLALVAIPFLILVLSPKVAVPMLVGSSIVLGGALLVESYRLVDVRKVAYLLFGGILGLPVGTYVLAKFDPHLLSRIIAGVTLVLALLLLLGVTRRFRRERAASVSAGFLSGTIGGSTAMYGPPVILLGLNQAWDKAHFRANLIAYFEGISLVNMFVFSGFDLVSGPILLLSMSAVPGMALGFWSGIRLKDRMPERVFRALAFGLVFAGGISALAFG